MKTLWITYSWLDNKNNDVEFIAQEIEKTGICVKLDRWNIQAGKRLWEQIDKFISSPSESDAWAIIATQNSLLSESCKEEVAYALNRALNTRGEAFPLIGIFPSSIDQEIIPSVLKTRLYVSLRDPNWIERIKSALEERDPSIQRPAIQPYTIDIRRLPLGKYAIELRPRAGTWAPFFCAVPLNEKEKIKPIILSGPKGIVPSGGLLFMPVNGVSNDGQWWCMSARDEATPTISYFLICDELPSRVLFGVIGGEQYIIEEAAN